MNSSDESNYQANYHWSEFDIPTTTSARSLYKVKREQHNVFPYFCP
jgi:hypothetical protein